MRKIMDKVEYAQDGGFNLLRMTKRPGNDGAVSSHGNQHQA